MGNSKIDQRLNYLHVSWIIIGIVSFGITTIECLADPQEVLQVNEFSNVYLDMLRMMLDEHYADGHLHQNPTLASVTMQALIAPESGIPAILITLN